MAKSGKGAGVRFYVYDNVGKKFSEIRDGFLCGRTEGDLQFPHDKVVSRKQCRFFIVGNDVYVADLDSTNRTKVNNVPIESGNRRRIQLHDVIEFGAQRLILSHQDKFPANVQDRIGSGKSYQAARRDDGQLTSKIPPEDLTNRTLVMLDKATFRKLRLEETFVRHRRRRHETDRGVRVPRAESRKSTWLLVFLLLFCWIGPLFSLYIAGALESGLPNEAGEIVLGLAVMMAIGSALALGFYTRVFKPLAQSRTTRVLIVFILAIGAALGGIFLTKKTGLLARASHNLAVARCVRSWDGNLCRVLLELDHDHWIRIPTALRAQIEPKLHR